MDASFLQEWPWEKPPARPTTIETHLPPTPLRQGMHLFSLPIGTRYACGDGLTLADCVS